MNHATRFVAGYSTKRLNETRARFGVPDTYVHTDNSRQQLAADIESSLDRDAQNRLGLFDFNAQSPTNLQLGLVVGRQAAVI